MLVRDSGGAAQAASEFLEDVRDLEAELRKVRRDGDTDIDYKKAMRDFVSKGRLEKYRISGRTFSSLLPPSPAFSCLL